MSEVKSWSDLVASSVGCVDPGVDAELVVFVPSADRQSIVRFGELVCISQLHPVRGATLAFDNVDTARDRVRFASGTAMLVCRVTSTHRGTYTRLFAGWALGMWLEGCPPRVAVPAICVPKDKVHRVDYERYEGDPY